MPLTDIVVRNAKPSKKTVKLSDDCAKCDCFIVLRDAVASTPGIVHGR